MTSFRRKMLFQIFKLSDTGVFILSVFVASWGDVCYRDHTTIAGFLSIRFGAVNFVVFLGLVAAWRKIFERHGLYEARRLESPPREWLAVVKATCIGTAVMMVVALVLRISAFSFCFLLALWLTSTGVTLLLRLVMRFTLKQVRKRGRNLRFVLMAGTNERAHEFARMLKQRVELGYRVAGYIDNNVHLPHKSMRLLGRLKDFPRIISETVIDEVVVALPIKSHYNEIQKIVLEAEEQGIVVRYLPELFETRFATMVVERFGCFDLMTIASGPGRSLQYSSKRFFDLVFALLAIAGTLPLMLLAAIGILLSSPGPILFFQDRVGYNKRIFRLYKFRTMVVNAMALQNQLQARNEADGPVFKIRNDPRVTRFGSFLRRTSIDELPQLFNVLKGDMSLVGPRPLPIRDYRGFNKDWQRRRFSVMPGITCLWQISGRNDIPFERWMELDMHYIDNWSLWEDLSILVRTGHAVLRRRGAS